VLDVNVRPATPNREDDLATGIRKQVCACACCDRIAIQRNDHVAGPHAAVGRRLTHNYLAAE
jgi:hypothetical protein